YAPTYYPGVPSAREAQPVTVGLGAEVQDIDFSVMLVPVSRVTGRVIDSQGPSQRGAIVSLAPSETDGTRANPTLGSRSGPNGTFQIENIPPGHYILSARAESDGTAAYAAQSFDTNGGDTADITLNLAPGATLAGTVAAEGTHSGSTLDLSRLRISTSS